MWYNAILASILRSPLHRMLSGSMLLLSVRGRKSGRVITLPISYAQAGERLTTVSFRQRTWWRNLRGEGAPVTIRLRGRQVAALGQVIEEPAQVAQELADYTAAFPERARFIGLALDASGKPDQAALQAKAESMVMIRFTLKSAPNALP